MSLFIIIRFRRTTRTRISEFQSVILWIFFFLLRNKNDTKVLFFPRRRRRRGLVLFLNIKQKLPEERGEDDVNSEKFKVLITRFTVIKKITKHSIDSDYSIHCPGARIDISFDRFLPRGLKKDELPIDNIERVKENITIQF